MVSSFLTRITVIRFLSQDQAVQQRFDANPDVLLPVIVLGELYFGAETRQYGLMLVTGDRHFGEVVGLHCERW